MRSLRLKQPTRTVEASWNSAMASHFDQVLRDTYCFQRALHEYREQVRDDSSFEELTFEAQQAILHRAQEIKDS
jgi:hypothetical protein